MEALPKALFNQRRIEAVRIGAGEAALPLDDVIGPAVALIGEQGRGDAALGRMRRVDALGRAAEIVELRNPAGVTAGNAQRVDELLGGVLAAKQQPSSRSRGAETV